MSAADKYIKMAMLIAFALIVLNIVAVVSGGANVWYSDIDHFIVSQIDSIAGNKYN